MNTKKTTIKKVKKVSKEAFFLLTFGLHSKKEIVLKY